MLRRFLDYLLSLIFIGTLLFFLICYVNKFKQQYPSTKLKLSGQLEYIDVKYTENLLSDILNNNLWNISVDKVKILLYTNPWIDSVFVQKFWPNVLQVKIIQQNPIARLNDQFFLTLSGKILSSTDENFNKLKQLNLPNFYGKSGQEDLMINTYLLLLEKLSPLGLFISKIYIKEDQGIEVQLNNQVILKLGTFDLSARLSRFFLAYKKRLQPIISDVAYIDLRYTNGIAVYWTTNNNLSSKDGSRIEVKE